MLGLGPGGMARLGAKRAAFQPKRLISTTTRSAADLILAPTTEIASAAFDTLWAGRDPLFEVEALQATCSYWGAGGSPDPADDLRRDVGIRERSTAAPAGPEISQFSMPAGWSSGAGRNGRPVPPGYELGVWTMGSPGIRRARDELHAQRHSPLSLPGHSCPAASAHRHTRRRLDTPTSAGTPPLLPPDRAADMVRTPRMAAGVSPPRPLPLPLCSTSGTRHRPEAFQVSLTTRYRAQCRCSLLLAGQGLG